MSKIVYRGETAGLKRTGSRAGDMNSPFDYEVYCHCEREGEPTLLGPLGRFAPNAVGDRSVVCPRCKDVTVVDKNAQVKLVAPLQSVLEGMKH